MRNHVFDEWRWQGYSKESFQNLREQLLRRLVVKCEDQQWQLWRFHVLLVDHHDGTVQRDSTAVGFCIVAIEAIHLAMIKEA
jgi:hypothetical protein